MTHTPGPWFIPPNQDDDIQVYSKEATLSGIDGSWEPSNSEGSYIICTVIGGMDDETHQANAKIIAAAPDLLYAAEIGAKYMRAMGLTEPGMGYQTVLNAIAKARGES